MKNVVYIGARVAAVLILPLLSILLYLPAQSQPASLPTPQVWVDEARGVTCYLAPNGVSCVAPTQSQAVTPAPVATSTHAPSATPLPTASATPRPTIAPTLHAPAVQLLNPGFEQGSANWTVFNVRSQNIESNAERLSLGASPAAVNSGDASLRIVGRWTCWRGGVFQTVSVPRFTRLRFSASSIAWANQSDNFSLPHDNNVYTRLEVGIDPDGGTDADVTGIRWAGRDGTKDWRRVSVDAVALADRVTVFVLADMGGVGQGRCNWALPFMLAFFDDASLTVLP